MFRSARKHSCKRQKLHENLSAAAARGAGRFNAMLKIYRSSLAAGALVRLVNQQVKCRLSHLSRREKEGPVAKQWEGEGFRCKRSGA